MFTSAAMRQFEQTFPKMIKIPSAGRNHKNHQDSKDPLEQGLPIQTLQSLAVNLRAVSATRTSFSILLLHPRSLDSFYCVYSREMARPERYYMPTGL